MSQPSDDAALFRGWTRRWSAAGSEFVRDGALVQVSFAIAPIVPAARIVRELLAQMRSAGAQASYADGERGATRTGEHFVRFALAGGDGSGALERRVGIIYGDQHMTAIDGTGRGAALPEMQRLVDALVRTLPLRQGPARHRRCRHRVPAGWVVRARDMTTHLHAPDGDSVITVLPADPFTVDSIVKKFVYEDVLLDFQPQSRIEPRRHVTPLGLRGEIVIASGTASGRAGTLTVTTALLQDRSFRYVVRWQRSQPARDDYEAAFKTVIDSLEAPPRPQVLATPGESGLWTD